MKSSSLIPACGTTKESFRRLRRESWRGVWLERISSVATVERAFDRNRDIVDQGMSDEIDSAIGGLREYASSLDVAEASREEMLKLYALSDAIVKRSIEQSKSAMLSAGIELRESCSR